MKGHNKVDTNNKSVNRDILRLQESERRRIAEDLHDTTVQELVYLSQQLELALVYFDKEPIQSKLEIISARKNIKNTINNMRETIYNLRPMSFDDLGWKSSINKLYDELNSSSINIHFDIDDLDTSDGITAITIYRIICELARNSIKHSEANNLWVDLHLKDNNICICVKDDGNGISNTNKANHFGLEFVNERVNLLSGEINICSNTNEFGTIFNIIIPSNDNN